MPTPTPHLSLTPAPTHTATWLIHCDGSALPNPGRMGLGAVIVAPDGSRQTLSVDTHSTGCNNEAELRAVMAALNALPAGACGVKLHSDNSIVVAQLTRMDAPPIARLATLFEEARLLLADFAPWEVRWVPRHKNAEADALARGALGMLPKVAVLPSKRARHKR